MFCSTLAVEHSGFHLLPRPYRLYDQSVLDSCLQGGSTGENVSQQQLPEYVRNAPHTVQVAFQFALQHPELLARQPYYCGCGPTGHTSSLQRFIRGVTEQGQIVFDSWKNWK